MIGKIDFGPSEIYEKFLLTPPRQSTHHTPVMKLKTIFALVLFALGTAISAQAARRNTSDNPPPASGTDEKLVVSPL
jgi:hypothetical protein